MRRSSAGTLSTPGQTSRLFHHDRLIAWNALRATFTGWHDRVIAALMLLAGLAIVRSWFTDRPWTVAALAAFAVAAMIGVGAGRLVATRLAFHAFDGLLAADALHPQMCRRYMAAWQGVGLALLAVVTLIARPSMLIVSVPAYLAGVLVAGLASGVRISRRMAGTTRPRRTLRAWSHHSISGVAAAAALLLSLWPARTLGTDALLVVVGSGTVLLAMMLTSVDDAIVRFMTIAGHGSRRIIFRHAKGMATFGAVSLPGCWIIVGPVATSIAAAVCAAMLWLLILRILAYRLHAKRFADLLVAILAGLLMLVAYAMPVALPVVAPAMLWQLERRGRTKTWLLA